MVRRPAPDGGLRGRSRHSRSDPGRGRRQGLQDDGRRRRQCRRRAARALGQGDRRGPECRARRGERIARAPRSIRAIAEAAERNGRALHDVRHTTETFPTGKGTKRPGRRLLTVGTDCSVGKKYTALALERGMRERGFDADFRATGQTGVFISGRGVAIDAVVADFISGAVEWVAPAAEPNHWDLIEGQGSLFHPSFAGVSSVCCTGHRPTPSSSATSRPAAACAEWKPVCPRSRRSST